MNAEQFFEIDAYETDNTLQKVWINLSQVVYVKDFHMEKQEPHIAFEIGTTNWIFKTYHDLPMVLKAALIAADKL